MLEGVCEQRRKTLASRSQEEGKALNLAKRNILNYAIESLKIHAFMPCKGTF